MFSVTLALTSVLDSPRNISSNCMLDFEILLPDFSLRVSLPYVLVLNYTRYDICSSVYSKFYCHKLSIAL